jgi:hypothetical protein
VTPAEARAQAIRLLLNEFRDAGWKDQGGAALSVCAAFFDDSSVLDSADKLEPWLPTIFIDVNGLTVDTVRSRLSDVRDKMDRLSKVASAEADRVLIPIDEIDSFERVRQVPPEAVATFSKPLALSEDIVEQIIARILGEPFRQKDWGGELDDLFTGRVVLNGHRIQASFMLKGSGLRGKLKPKNLGLNGDQITRMCTQPADLFVVQHVHAIDSSVHHQLRNAIVAKRVDGRRGAMGTLWDGVDTARLGVAYGFLDPDNGTLLPEVLN